MAGCFFAVHMSLEVKIPAVGESVTSGMISAWLKNDGDAVNKGEPLFTLETDKVSTEVTADAAGTLRIKAQAGALATGDENGADSPAAESFFAGVQGLFGRKRIALASQTECLRWLGTAGKFRPIDAVGPEGS